MSCKWATGLGIVRDVRRYSGPQMESLTATQILVWTAAGTCAARAACGPGRSRAARATRPTPAARPPPHPPRAVGSMGPGRHARSRPRSRARSEAVALVRPAPRGALAAVQGSGSSLPDLPSVAVASPSRSFREAQTREGSWSPSRRENGSIRPSLPRPCRSLAARSSAARAHPSVRRALECGHTRRGLTVRPCGAETQSSPPAEGSTGGSAARALPAWRPACPHRGAVGCALSDPGTPRERSAAKSFGKRRKLKLVAIFTGESPVRTSKSCRDVLMRKLSRPTTPGRPGHKFRYSEANPTVSAAPCECAFQRKARDACTTRKKR